MPLPTPQEYIELIRRSELVPDDRLGELAILAGSLDDVKLLALELIRGKWLTRWQANQLLAGFTRFQLGKYRLIDMIGRGASCNVFRAEHLTMQREVALKILARRLQDDPVTRKAFYDEARIVSSLQHRNIVQVFDVQQSDGRHMIVMELIDGANLHDLVRLRGPLPVTTAIDYILQTAEGLAHAHAGGWVHCDIKPANLVVNQRRVVKILDMGTSRGAVLDLDQYGSSTVGSRTRSEAMLGTVDYMAPELALDAPGWDHRVDLYSLGATLYYLLAGQPPFPDGSLAQKLLKHQTESPAPLATHRTDLPDALAGLCKRMLAKRPERRPESADAVIEELRALL